MAVSVRFLDSNGFTQINLEDLPDIFAGVNDTPRKFGFRNTSDRALANLVAKIEQVGTNDGASMLRTALDSASVAPSASSPTGFGASVGGATGAWGATGTYGYRITSLTAVGESAPSEEITAVIAATTQRATLSWTQAPGATGYKIYRTPTPGTYGATTLVTTIGSGATVTYNDDGAATSAGTPPSANTTGGWIATPALSAPGAGGVWGATGPYFWIVVAVDATGIPIAISIQATINVDNTTKTVTLSFPTVAQAASFKIYRSTVTGVYTSPALAGTAAALATSFVDTGAAVTTGGQEYRASYGIPPTDANFTTADKVVGAVPIGRDTLAWLKRAVPAGTPEAGNPRQANILLQES